MKRVECEGVGDNNGFFEAGAEEGLPALQPAVIARHMLGRCANGYERDSGRLSHAVRADNWQSLCGAEPGRRSAGWSEYADESVTCPRCLRKMKAQ